MPSGPQEYADEYYLIWEQEYAAHGGPPFPSPTPYAIKGTTFLLGQRVAVGAVHVTVNATAGPPADRPGVVPGTQQLYTVALDWLNPTTEPIPISYVERVRLRAVRAPSGAIVTGDAWGITADALRLASLATVPDRIPPGASDVRLPVIGPVGTPVTVELVVDGGAPAPTPAPNDAVRRQDPHILTVQWTEGSLQGIGPSCADPGAVTPWSDAGSVAWGRDVNLRLDGPPGVERLRQIVLGQVGKPYVWGAKGPEAFDCSGLASWSYGQIGIRIPQGTAGQWPGLRPVGRGDLQLGDLIFFDIEGRGQIDHVGILVGDLNGDGRWDMVHAASPRLGVRVDYSVFESAFYAPRIRGFRTAR